MYIAELEINRNIKNLLFTLIRKLEAEKAHYVYNLDLFYRCLRYCLGAAELRNRYLSLLAVR